MTRETKIGLLVGLAFIIVIGILLSDHLTSSTEPPSAPMSQAGSIVRSAVNTPAPVQQPAAQVSAPQVQPNQPVRAADEFQPRPQPVKIVQVNTPPQNEPVTITSPNTNPVPQSVAAGELTNSQMPNTSELVAQNTPVQAGSQPLQAAQTPLTRSNDPLMSRLSTEAQKLGEPVVAVGGNQAPAAAMSKYKVEPGDTLSKIATKVYGTGSKTAVAAIIDANPSLKANPNLVIEGRTYNIPPLTSAKPATASPDTNIAMVPVSTKPQTGQSPVQSPPKPEAGASYVVEEGDNLTRIAREQCGTEDAVAAIKELNRDLLKGGDVIRPGMKLKMPAKSVAVSQ